MNSVPLAVIIAITAVTNTVSAQEVGQTIDDTKDGVATGTLQIYCPPNCTLDQAIRSASNRYGVSESRLRCLVFRESTNDPNAQNGVYYGYTQFDLTTWNQTSYRDYPRSNGWANIHGAAELIARGEGSRWPVWQFC